ncbi:MAG: lycopene cyclase family protein, partial [Ilumatobacteraceae bacterium]
MAGPELDVAVIGDGPAGLALAAACAKGGARVLVVGPDRPWTATYATWVDDVPALPSSCFGATAPSVVVHTTRRQVLERPYGVLDGGALCDHLGTDLDRLRTVAQGVQHFLWGSRVRVADGDHVDARLVVDAAGRGGQAGALSPPAAWQSAYGVVVDVPPRRFDADRPTFMDLRSVGRTGGPPTFCYVVPVDDGWLVEETVLASREPVDPGWLADRLAVRLGADAPPRDRAAGRVEVVHIPMGGRLPSTHDP